MFWDREKRFRIRFRKHLRTFNLSIKNRFLSIKFLRDNMRSVYQTIRPVMVKPVYCIRGSRFSLVFHTEWRGEGGRQRYLDYIGSPDIPGFVNS